MAVKKKKKKDMLPDLSKVDILTPLSISDIGSNGDPCFGKEYDLTTSECKSCGDSELCAMVFAQKLNKTREDLEKDNHYKDMDTLLDLKGIKKYMRSQKRQGETKKSIIEKAMKKYSIARSDARDIYRGLTKGSEE